MDWINGLFTVHSAIQTVVVLSLICYLGLILGKIRVKGISLGVAFVFFIGIIAGHWGLDIDPKVLEYAETFGLVLFVYPCPFATHQRTITNHGGHSLRCRYQHARPWSCSTGSRKLRILHSQCSTWLRRGLSPWRLGRYFRHDITPQVICKTRRPDTTFTTRRRPHLRGAIRSR